MTALGSLVEPEVNRNLTMVSGPVAAMAWSTAAVALVLSRSAKGTQALPSTWPRAQTTVTSAGTAALMARA